MASSECKTRYMVSWHACKLSCRIEKLPHDKLCQWGNDCDQTIADLARRFMQRGVWLSLDLGH